MQATIVGVTRMSGIGKESKNPYDMVRALMLNKIEPFSKEGFKREGYGFEVVEVEVAKESYGFFGAQKYPLTGDVQIEQQIRGGKLVSVVVGLLNQKAAA